MSAALLAGKPLAEKIKKDILQEVESLKSQSNKKPCLSAISIGENEGSKIYMKAQNNASNSVGIDYRILKLADDTIDVELIKKIEELNKDHSVTAIILQMPMPPSIDAKKMISSIHPSKDAEGMHPYNLGKLILSKSDIIPCTAASSFELISSTGVDLYGKEVVIVGHSEIVGKPLSLLLLDKFSTVTICHIGTSKRGLLESHVRRAEVLIVAVGKANLIPGTWIKEGAIVIDVGINRVNGKIVGDVDFEGASQKAGFITPVPGGVGVLTTMMLMRNVIRAYKLQMTNGKT